MATWTDLSCNNEAACHASLNTCYRVWASLRKVLATMAKSIELRHVDRQILRHHKKAD
jgi:hypothetical protein